MISIVIPLYNKEKSITTTLQSVVNQTYTDYEVIVVDDGSTDRSADVVRDFIRANDGMSRKMNDEPEVLNEPHLQCSMSRDKSLNDEKANPNEPLSLNDGKIRLISQANAGVSAARNRGITEAKGEYVCLLDGDDLWDKDFLEEMVRLIEDYPRKSIYGLGSRKLYGDEAIDEHTEPYYRGDAQWEWDRMAYFGSSSCINKQDAIALGLFDTLMTHGEDIDMWWRLLLKNGGACYTKPFSYYRQDAENRAMHKVIPLERFIPYYIDKYKDARMNNTEFRQFFDREMVQRLYPYLFDKQYRKEAKRLGRKLDYSQLKFTLWFRMTCPHIYRLITKR